MRDESSELFRIMDIDGSGLLDHDDFVKGCELNNGIVGQEMRPALRGSSSIDCSFTTVGAAKVDMATAFTSDLTTYLIWSAQFCCAECRNLRAGGAAGTM